MKAMDLGQAAAEFPIDMLKIQMTGASSATRSNKLKKDYSMQHLQVQRIQKRVEL